MPSAVPLFDTFFGGGFECSTHRRAHDRTRVDVVASSGHGRHARAGYDALARHSLGWSRDGLRWHLIETAPGHYDWSSFLPMHRAARAAGVTAVWDLCHYGFPDGLDIWSPAFVDRFAAFAHAVALVVRGESDDVPWWCPVNEISFWSFAGGDAAFLPPFAHGRGFELKVQLARAAVAAARAVREVDPRARLLWADPMIHVAPDLRRPDLDPEGQRQAMFQGWDLIAGRLWPQAGGDESLLDVVGVNYYPNNQWVMGGGPHLDVGDRGYRPLRHLLTEASERYGRPVVVAETGTEGDRRASWMAYVGAEVRAAVRMDADVRGVCWYPVVNHPGWDDERHCPNGLFGYPDDAGERPVYEPLRAELARQVRLTAPRRASVAA